MLFIFSGHCARFVSTFCYLWDSLSPTSLLQIVPSLLLYSRGLFQSVAQQFLDSISKVNRLQRNNKFEVPLRKFQNLGLDQRKVPMKEKEELDRTDVRCFCFAPFSPPTPTLSFLPLQTLKWLPVPPPLSFRDVSPSKSPAHLSSSCYLLFREPEMT